MKLDKSDMIFAFIAAFTTGLLAGNVDTLRDKQPLETPPPESPPPQPRDEFYFEPMWGADSVAVLHWVLHKADWHSTKLHWVPRWPLPVRAREAHAFRDGFKAGSRKSWDSGGPSDTTMDWKEPK